MTPTFRINPRPIQQAMKLYAQATRKDMVDVINRAALKTAIGDAGTFNRGGAVGLTPKAKREGILKELSRGIRNKMGKRGKPTKKTYAAANILAYRIVQKLRTTGKLDNFSGQIPKWLRGGARGMTLRAAAQKLINHKLSSVGYVAAGWVKVAKDLGAPIRKRVSLRGMAGKSTAVKAKLTGFGQIKAILTNRARGAALVGEEALQRALNHAAYDMATYARKRMQQTAAKHSGRRKP